MNRIAYYTLAAVFIYIVIGIDNSARIVIQDMLSCVSVGSSLCIYVGNSQVVNRILKSYDGSSD